MSIVQRHLPKTDFFGRIDMLRMLVVAATLAVLPVAHAVGPVVALERVSVKNGGASLQGDSFYAAISVDGRYVAFDSASEDLVPGAVQPTAKQRVASSGDYPINVYLRDRVAGTTELISIGLNGTAPNNFSYTPSISDDGRYVGFASIASNLAPGDTNGLPDVFVRDRLLGTTARVSLAGDGPDTAGGGYVYPQVSSWMTGDGRYVVFCSPAKLTANNTNAHMHLYRRDLVANTTVLIDVNPSNVAADNVAGCGASISTDGRFVMFLSAANDILPNANPYLTLHLYVRDMLAGVTTSLTPYLTMPGLCPFYAGQSGTYNLSRNGRFAMFDSTCTDLAAGQDPLDGAFVRDLLLGVTQPFRLNDGGAPGGYARGDGVWPSMSNSGRYAVARSYTTNVVSGDSDAYSDVFLHDFVTARTFRISQRADTGAPANESSYSPLLSTGGRVIFASDASNLVDGDDNGLRDIFVATLDAVFAAGFE